MDYKILCLEVVNLSKEIGKFLRQEIKAVKPADIEEKGTHDFVSYVDKTAEAMIVKRLSELLPDSGFIAEEGTSSKKSDKLNWIVDPLDGTTNFLHHVPLYSVSIALMEKDEIVLGVVYEPNLDECFYAWQGGKAYLNNNHIHVSTQKSISKSLVATGFPYYDYDEMQAYMQLFEWFAIHTSGLRRLGSAAVDLIYTACGRYEAFYEYGLKPWDVAAGAFIVQQAGGKVTDFDGGKDYVFGKELLASNAILHKEFLQAVQTYFKGAK